MASADDHMTIDLFIGFLLKQKETLGGDAPVAVMWDGSLSDISDYGVQNGVLIFGCEDFASSKLNKNFDYVGFEYADDDAAYRPQRQQEEK